MKQFTRHFLLWYGLFETFVFTGNILGWTALHYMLRKEGIYSYVCEDSLDIFPPANSTNWRTATVATSFRTEHYFNDSEVSTVPVEVSRIYIFKLNMILNKPLRR